MMGESSDGQVVKVRRETLEALFTCPLCKQLFDEPLSINECMHTFCKKCIHDKIIQEDAHSCPVCNRSLGCSPLDKLRADHDRERLRNTLFPLKGNKSKEICQVAQLTKVNKGDKEKSMVEAEAEANAKAKDTEEEEDTPLLVVPFIDVDSDPEPKATTKKKEKSLSSLVSNDSHKKANKKTIITATKRSNAGATKSYRACRKTPLSPGHLLELDDDEAQVSTLKSPEERVDYKQTDEAVKASKSVDNLCSNPPVFMLEGSSKSKSLKVISNNPHKHKGEEKMDDQEFAIHEEEKSLSSLVPSTSVKSIRKYRRRMPVHRQRLDVVPKLHTDKSKRRAKYQQQKSDTGSDNSSSDMMIIDGKNKNQRKTTHCGQKPNVIPNVVIDLTMSPDDQHEQTTTGHQQSSNTSRIENACQQPLMDQQRDPDVAKKDRVDLTTRRPKSLPVPIWFALLAAKDQKGDAPLPQLSYPYIRMRDENAPVSCIAKYLAKKFNLTSEYEVELLMHGRPIQDSLKLRDLEKVWQELTQKSDEFIAVAGSSAKDVTMQITYARKYSA